ncbi:protein of unknown function [Methylorubrum extorquens DM4]|uniref:Uncharacterized protein n=1 Tax=Methylorubrum extorquens (strain DSM 6343 / CIP 106787 / DM4) TaxID=661410 RepID=C7CHJ8_METED|nr:protein of unknown function [Methylorubrum extorquens DM4]
MWNAGDIRDVAPDRTAEALAVLHSLPLRCLPRSRTRLAAGAHTPEVHLLASQDHNPHGEDGTSTTVRSSRSCGEHWGRLG